MNFRFADFEFDEPRRALRLRGREIPLQPRVFDLLGYLLHHRDRVVEKQELLNRLWPGRIVVEGALQRVVSLARRALREGNAGDAIRTYSGRGYRFCTDAVEELPAVGDSALPVQNHWALAAGAFESADAANGLTADGLERWAHALLYSGRARESLAPLERAVAARAMAGDRAGAARAALLLSQLLFEQRDLALAAGWLGRAREFLDGAPECRERGSLHWISARAALVNGDLEKALGEAERAQALGKRLPDPGLETLGLLYRGHALMAQGEVRRGAALHDQAAATVFSGEVEGWVGGLVYCGIIWGCRNRLDWQRAAQWTDRFTDWCRNSGLEGYPGTCRLHRAEVLSVRGELAQAEQELARAQPVLAAGAPWAEGDGWRILGDIHLMRGALDAAERAFREAHRLGWDPNPGYARLLAARGKSDAALRSLEQTLADPVWANRERRGLLLAQFALLCAECGQLPRARSALAESEARPELADTPAVQAQSAQAQAEIAYAEGDTAAALTALRRGLRLWREVGSPLNAARCHRRLAEWLAAAGDPDAAEMETAAARALSQASLAPDHFPRYGSGGSAV